jgi:hypothetical protein
MRSSWSGASGWPCTLKKEAPRPGDTNPDGKPRLKTNYEESAFRQLQAELGIKK